MECLPMYLINSDQLMQCICGYMVGNTVHQIKVMAQSLTGCFNPGLLMNCYWSWCIVRVISTRHDYSWYVSFFPFVGGVAGTKPHTESIINFHTDICVLLPDFGWSCARCNRRRRNLLACLVGQKLAATQRPPSLFAIDIVRNVYTRRYCVFV